MIAPAMTATDDPAQPRPSAWVFVLVLAWVATVAVVFGWPSLSGEFLDGDDCGLVRDHVLINHPSWKHVAQLLGMIHGDLYQPVPMLTFMANYATGGDATWGYHLVNIALHAVCAMLVALLAWRIGRCPRIGCLTGVMFACHPLAMEPVAWVTGRIMLLAAMFSLVLILLFALRSDVPGAVWSWGACVAWLLSLTSKVLPSVPFAAAWCDLNLYPRRTRRWHVTFAILLAETAALTGLAYWSTSRLEYFSMMQAEATTPLPARLMLASRYYFQNYVWPTRLSAWSPPPVNVPVLSMPVAIGALQWAVLLGVMGISYRRCRAAFVGIGLFVLLFAPFVAAMTARTFLTADRYMYLPLAGLHLAVAAWAVRGVDALSHRARVAGVAAGGAAVVALAGFWTTQAHGVAGVFHDSLSQANRAIAMYPDDLRAWVELLQTRVKHAEALKLRGEAERARQESCAAIAIVDDLRRQGRDDPALAAQAGEAYWQLGDAANAVRELRQAAEAMPRNPQVRYYLGLSLASLGQVEEARALWLGILYDKDRFLPATTALARSFRDEGDTIAAQHWYERALQLNSHHRDSLYELAFIHMGRREWDSAESLLRNLLELSEHDQHALLNLAVCRVNQGDSGEALAIYDRLLALARENAVVLYNRAQLLASLRRIAEAEHDYRAILARQPAHRAAAIGLHELLQSAARYDEMVELWSAVMVAPRRPDDANAWLALSCALAGQRQCAADRLMDLGPDSPAKILQDWTQVYLQLSGPDGLSSASGSAIDTAVVRSPETPREREQLQAAISAFKEWHRTHADDPAACIVLAWAFKVQGQHVLSLHLAERARDLNPTGPWSARAAELIRALQQ